MASKDLKINTMENLYNAFAEQSVIGGMLINAESDNAIAALEMLRPEDFYLRDNKVIWRSICALSESQTPIDLLTLSDHLAASGESITFTYLGDMVKHTPSQANMQTYARIVKDNSQIRVAIAKCHEATEKLYSQGDAQERINSALQSLAMIGVDDEKDDEPKDSKDVLQEVLDDMQKALESGSVMSGLSTGFENIDAMTSGMQEADLIVIAARPSMGKTTLAMNIGENVAYLNEKKGNVLVFSLEMPRKALVKKTVCRFGSLFMNKINTGKALESDHDTARLGQAMERVTSSPGKFIIDDKGGLHISQLRARAKRAKMRYGRIDLVIVDYIQLAQADGSSENEVISKVSSGLKNLAKELRCPVIALSQLNRALTGRPEMKNLRGSGSIEQDADVIIFLHDEDYEGNRGDHSLTEVIIGKQRVGPTGTTYLQPELAFSRFADTKRLPASEPEPEPKPYKKREIR